MTFSSARPDVLALMYDQQRNYHAQVGQNHESFSKLYKKLARIEHVLSREPERPMKRSCRKKWKWSQMLTKRSIASLQDRQDTLYQHLDQCASLIESYNEQTLMSPSTTWIHLPISPYMLTPSSPFPFSPWAATFSAASSSGNSETTYWDLSRLREPSPFDSMADSGYYGPHSGASETIGPSLDELDQIFSNVNSSPSAGDGRGLCVPLSATSNTQAMSEGDEPSISQSASSPTKSGAQTHRRCVSAEVGQVMNGGLVLPTSSTRGTSVDPCGEARDGDNGLVG